MDALGFSVVTACFAALTAALQAMTLFVLTDHKERIAALEQHRSLK